MPTLDAPETETAAAPPAPVPSPAPRAPRHASFARLALDVALIAAGVFLGLLGDQWRERAEHRELAQASLRRFREEFRINRDAVAAVRAHHLTGLRDVEAYLVAVPAARARLAMPFRGTHPAFLEYTAWDLAIATQSLGYVDPGLAQAISRVYAIQRQLDGATRDITQVMYLKASGDGAGLLSFLGSMATYFGDCNLIEPRLLAQYDQLLPRLDRAIARTR